MFCNLWKLSDEPLTPKSLNSSRGGCSLRNERRLSYPPPPALARAPLARALSLSLSLSLAFHLHARDKVGSGGGGGGIGVEAHFYREVTKWRVEEGERAKERAIEASSAVHISIRSWSTIEVPIQSQFA